jgi:hypothetical protein
LQAASAAGGEYTTAAPLFQLQTFPASPPNPNRSTVVLRQDVPKPATQPVVFTMTEHLRAFNLAERAFVVSNTAPRGPDPAPAILDHVVVATITVRHRGKLTAVQFREADGCSYPQTPIPGTQEGQSTTGLKFMKTIVPGFELDAVEADEPIECAYPQETVSRLRDGNRCGVEYTFLESPSGVSVLRQLLTVRRRRAE